MPSISATGTSLFGFSCCHFVVPSLPLTCSKATVDVPRVISRRVALNERNSKTSFGR